jgi:hypothetical protein
MFGLESSRGSGLAGRLDASIHRDISCRDPKPHLGESGESRGTSLPQHLSGSTSPTGRLGPRRDHPEGTRGSKPQPHWNAHWPGPPPPQRQQAKQSPVQSHWQHQNCIPPPLQHAVGHSVVTPSQVTRPRSQMSQLRSTAEQVLLPSQDTVPEAQFAVAVQMDFGPPPGLGLFAAKSGSPRRAAQEGELLAADEPRIAARTSLLRGATLGVWAKPAAAETRAKVQIQTTIHAFFMRSSRDALLLARDYAPLQLQRCLNFREESPRGGHRFPPM